jgi:hypothetical protein
MNDIQDALNSKYKLGPNVKEAAQIGKYAASGMSAQEISRKMSIKLSSVTGYMPEHLDRVIADHAKRCAKAMASKKSKIVDNQ